jgi:hypothetical protein
MAVNRQWPEGVQRTADGDPRYEDMVLYCSSKGFAISLSAMGRFGMRMRMLSRMKAAGAIVRDVMKDLDAEKAGATQKAVAEMITAQTIEFLANKEELEADEIRDISKAIKDAAAVALSADKYIRTQITEKTEKAAQAIDSIAAKKQIDPETLRLIREQVYGIVK